MTAPKALTRPTPKRDHFGRYRLPVPGQPKPIVHTRVTTLVKAIDDTSNLQKWACRMTALGLVDRPDLRALVAANVDDKNALNGIVEKAMEAAKSGAGANMGTALHALCEQVDLGQSPKLGEFEADVNAYRACLAAAGVEILPEWVERIVRVPGLTCAGTFDRLVRLGDTTFVADLKTGSIDFGHTTIPAQLACYAHGEAWDGADGYEPLPDVDQTRGLIIHLEPGKATCTLHWCDLVAGWEFAQLCHTIREVRKRKDTITAFDAPPTPTLTVVVDNTVAERAEWIKGRIASLSDTGRESLRLTWTGPPVLDELASHAGIDRVAAALDRAEAAVEAPFTPPDPTLTTVDEPPAEPSTRATLDDGDPITEDDYTALRTRLQQHPCLDLIGTWGQEAVAAGHPFGIQGRRQRQAEIVRAVMMLAPQGDDMARVLLEVVTGDEMQPTFTTGAALGLLSVEQATRLHEVAKATAENPDALSFATGRPTVALVGA